LRRKKAQRDSFDEVFREYDEVRPSYPDKLIKDIICISKISKDGKILEVGCGTGQATLLFAELGYSMTCLDIGKKLVKKAREKCKNYPNVKIHNISFEDWQPEKEAFDLLISGTAFHWIPPEIGYPKAAEVLKDTGFIALFWNMPPTRYTGFFQDVQRVYQRFVPEWEDPRDGPGTEKKILERKNYIDGTGLFEKIGVSTYPWSRIYSTDQYLKLLDTYSDHRNLGKEKRNQLYEGIRTLINEEHGGKVIRPYLSVLFIARKKDICKETNTATSGT
jgi:SAM-dependent methyltransferase